MSRMLPVDFSSRFSSEFAVCVGVIGLFVGRFSTRRDRLSCVIAGRRACYVDEITKGQRVVLETFESTFSCDTR